MESSIVILGVFVADTSYRAARQPRMGETILGESFVLGPGGKGSNQAVAAGRLGAPVTILTRLGTDPFAEMARQTWADAGVTASAIPTPESYTGAAYIFIEDGSGDNAIIIAPGAAALITPDDILASRTTIERAAVFVTQLEQPLPAARDGLSIARDAGVATILNPAPAAPLDDDLLGLCDFLTPNETETESLTGLPVTSLEEARKAAEVLCVRGVGTAIITLGENGVLVHGADGSHHVPAFNAGPVVETTGAGDAFNGGFAVGLSRGMAPVEAARFGCAVAGISVTRPGAARSMPNHEDVAALLAS